MRIAAGKSLFQQHGTWIVAACLALSSCTLEQVQFGQDYNLYSQNQPGCPSLNWRFEVNPQRELLGSLGRTDQIAPFATMTGTLNQDDTFQATATDVGKQWQATVSGRFRTRLITMSINGKGASCDGHTFNWFFTGLLAGGGGGGGGR